MTLRQILSDGTLQLKNAGITEYENDAWLLFEYAFEMSRAKYLAYMMDTANEEQVKAYNDLITRRCKREPLQYITGKAYFCGMEFFVNENVLIPRFDTEILVEKALIYISEGNTVLDMCTGSGCIAISIGVLSKAKVMGVDISEKALEVARQNKKINNADNVEFVLSDMFSAIENKYDFIISNPPYIKSADILDLEPEVKEKEPMLALDGHEDGLFFYRILAKEGRKHLNPGGALFMEIGYDEAEAVSMLLIENGFTDTEVLKDLAGLDRVVCGWRK